MKTLLLLALLATAPGAMACESIIVNEPYRCTWCGGGGGFILYEMTTVKGQCTWTRALFDWHPCFHAFTGASVAGNHASKTTASTNAPRFYALWNRFYQCKSGHGL